MKSVSIIVVVSGLTAISQLEATNVFSENMGSPTATTAVASHTFKNSGNLTYSGTADVRNTLSNAGEYTGASGGGNVFFTGSASSSFTISNIDTTDFAPGTLDLSFGAFKSTTASDMTEFQLGYSTDGTTYTPLTIAAQPTGTNTASWRLISFTNTAIPISSTLSLRWVNAASASGTGFRLDDVVLSGDPIPEPSSLAAVITGGLALTAFRRIKRPEAA
jgi:hypothetical protein